MVLEKCNTWNCFSQVKKKKKKGTTKYWISKNIYFGTFSLISNHDVDAINESLSAADVDKLLPWPKFILVSAYGLLTGQDLTVE